MTKKMTAALCVAIGLLFATPMQAQVKIGDNPNTIHKSSILELESDTMGVLFPRVDIVDLNTWAPLKGDTVAGMMVYNQNAAIGKGFYYWQDAQWIKQSSATDAEWKDGGNYIYAAKAKTAGNDVIVTDEGKIGIGRIPNVDELIIQSKDSFASINISSAVTNEEGGAIKFSRDGVMRWKIGVIRNTLDLSDGSMSGSDFGIYRLRDDGSFSYPSILYGERKTNFLGINTTTPKAQLHVNSFANTDDKIIFKLDNYDGEVFRVNAAGNVGIGTTDPQTKLEVAGNIKTGGIYAAIDFVSSNYTVKDNDYTILIAAPDITITLPDPSTCKGRILILANSNNYPNVISSIPWYFPGNSTQNTLVQSSYTFQSDGNKWYLIGIY